ncbi:thioredoxin [Magnaporthiopsis poae ATCC 64411]|uniref:Thioredoxin n=1 Tax=Magnaporthiopsis poae (strain ATCC 64411 / 73-15) TaxID=644358 RepID=A0A0C4E557_MAGP6|nr:thioredoxin [Magnaporthiopsis poae ATCC 64411]
MPRIRIDIYSDTGCPWCYIGNKYLDLAIEQFSSRNPDAVFELAWHPFFLFPNAKVSAPGQGSPVDGRPRSAEIKLSLVVFSLGLAHPALKRTILKRHSSWPPGP